MVSELDVFIRESTGTFLAFSQSWSSRKLRPGQALKRRNVIRQQSWAEKSTANYTLRIEKLRTHIQHRSWLIWSAVSSWTTNSRVPASISLKFVSLRRSVLTVPMSSISFHRFTLSELLKGECFVPARIPTPSGTDIYPIVLMLKSF